MGWLDRLGAYCTGVYSSNSFWNCGQVISFFITDPPEFVGPEADTAVLEGGIITLVCATGVNGNPTPTISWMDNNGTTVSDGTGISGATTLSLTVSGVTNYQAGNWTCTAENSQRAAERQVSLTVVGEYVGYDVSILWHITSYLFMYDHWGGV